jgi:hypothetical protein
VPPKSVEEYVHWVLSEDRSLEKVEPRVRKQLEADYVSALEDEINAAIISALPDAQLGDVEKLLEHAPMSEVQDWIEQQVPDARDIVAGVLLRFRNEYLSADNA